MLAPADLERAAQACAETFLPAIEEDWEVPAGDLEWSCRRTLDHTADALMFYATHLATRSAVRRYGVRNTDPEATVPRLLEAVTGAAAILARVCAGAGPGTQAFHPAGMADVSGFIAMGCDEIIVHADDVARGLGVAYAPPLDLCAAVVARLFPWAPEGFDALATLRWANGRAALGEHERLGPDWYWHCAPLAEWDGTRRTRTIPPAWA